MSQIQLIDNFIQKIQELYNPDVGDFKRKVILYVKRLQENLKDSSLKLFFEELKIQVICNNHLTDTENLKKDIINRIASIKSSFKDH